MGASFRNTNQILGLAGCDLLTISPKLLEELASKENQSMKVYLKKDQTASTRDKKYGQLDEKTFRWMLNEDEMAHDKLADGIRKFAADAQKLEDLIRKRLEKQQ